MTNQSSTESIAKATGRPWEEWVSWLDSKGAKELDHKNIADLVRKRLETKVDNPGWWAQNVTVAYEQHIGRRAPGQRSDGSFEISVNKSLPGSREDIFAKVVEVVEARIEFNKVAFTNQRTSVTPVRSYWRCNLANGTKLEFAVGPRSNGSYMVTVSQLKIDSAKSAEAWKEYWHEFLTYAFDQ